MLPAQLQDLFTKIDIIFNQQNLSIQEENKQKFCELFELKLSKIELLKKQEVSP